MADSSRGWPPALVGAPDRRGRWASSPVQAWLPPRFAPRFAYPLVVADVGFLLFEGEDAGPACRVHREAVVAADAVLLVLGAREEQLRAGIDQLDLLLALGIAPERLRVAVNGIGGPGATARIQLERVIVGQLAERRFALDAWLPWGWPRARPRSAHWPARCPRAPSRRLCAGARAAARGAVPARRPIPRERKLRLLQPHGDARSREGRGAVTELTLEPTETVRARVERALASEEVNLASEAGRGRTEELIEETLRLRCRGAQRQAPPLDSGQRVDIAAELRNELIGSGRSRSGCWPTRSRRSG